MRDELSSGAAIGSQTLEMGAHTKRALQIQTMTATDGGVTSRGFAYETLSGRGHARRDATGMAARECERV
jgi:hypothetical protein